MVLSIISCDKFIIYNRIDNRSISGLISRFLKIPGSLNSLLINLVNLTLNLIKTPINDIKNVISRVKCL